MKYTSVGKWKIQCGFLQEFDEKHKKNIKNTRSSILKQENKQKTKL